MKTIIQTLVLLTCTTFSLSSTYAQGIINTIAGTGIPGFYGDGGKADTCRFYNPFDISLDIAGNIYVTDGNNLRVRKINKATNIITTIAGNGVDTFSADNVAATATGINPYGLFAAKNSDLFIADVGNNRVRKITAATGIITTVAGNGMQGYSGDTGLAVNEKLYWPSDVCTDSAGNIYIADRGNNRIRKVDATTGKISTVAGTGTAGYTGDGAIATAATLNAPTYICADKQSNVYFSDVNNNVVRKIIVGGNINTVAGNGIAGFSGDGNAATSARLLSPAGVFASDDGSLYIADEGNDRIRKVTGGIISTVAGGGTGPDIGDGGVSLFARLSSPTSVFADTSTAFFISDMLNQRIRFVQKSNGIVNIPGQVAFSIFPNPSSGVFNLQISGNANYEMKVFDIAGKVLYRSTVAHAGSHVDLSSLTAGIYLLQIKDGEKTAIQKLMISK